MSPFCGATDTPVFGTSGDVSREFQSKSGQPLFELGGGICVSCFVA